jgi:hypothetical protein
MASTPLRSSLRPTISARHGGGSGASAATRGLSVTWSAIAREYFGGRRCSSMHRWSGSTFQPMT